MLRSDKFKILRSQGYGFNCAMCEHMWHAHDCNLPTCGKECGGPMVGMAFPHYKGPVKGNLDKFCFVCGNGADVVAETEGGKVGVCSGHIEVLSTYSRPGERPPFVTKKYIPVME